MVFLQSALPVLAPVAPVIAHFVSVRLVAANTAYEFFIIYDPANYEDQDNG
ncbi:MAG: hypothetical protein P8P56_07300 [Yoonia sp.]|nr:hypothetical protein [Yoonia sp.]